jgi:hypothetical protein
VPRNARIERTRRSGRRTGSVLGAARRSCVRRHRLCPRPSKRVRRPCIVSQSGEPGLEEGADRLSRRRRTWATSPPVRPGRGTNRMMPPSARPDAVRDHTVEMDVQVERAAEALHEGDRAGSRAASAKPARNRCRAKMPRRASCRTRVVSAGSRASRKRAHRGSESDLPPFAGPLLM